MNEAATTQYTQIVYRRLAEPFEAFGREWPSEVWLVILGLVLLVGFFYIGWMYVKDSRGVGWMWASLLGVLRASVYGLLAWVFLLRAEQTWEETQVQSKVLVLFDVSGSMGAVDDIPTGKPNEKLPTRQDKVLAFLGDVKGDLKKGNGKQNFLANLEVNNPVTVYRFGTRLDDNYLLFRDGRNWTRLEYEDPARDPKAEALAAAKDANGDAPAPKPLAPELWSEFLRYEPKPQPAPEAFSKADKERLEKFQAQNKKLADVGFFNGTNLGGSALGLVNREQNNRVQGVIIFTDGRSTEGSPQAFKDLEERAKASHIPVFVVSVGDERPQVRLDITDVRVPDQVQPEDRFRAVVEVTGEGLADQRIDVELEVKHLRKAPDGKEQELPITLVEPEDKTEPMKRRTVIDLGKKLVLKPDTVPVFNRESPPRVIVEFPIDVRSLAAAAKIDLESSKELAGKKWELGETKEGELRFIARVPRDKLEVFAKPNHESDPSVLRVVKKPLRVLLFASAATREYQFVRTLMVREMEKKRAEVSICLQPAPGRTEQRPGVVQDVDPERLLTNFPTRLESSGKDDKLYALDEYDVVVAFDPDWTQLSDKQLKMLETWVDKGGGLVGIGGPVNTLQLARPGSYKDKLKPLLDLYPVVLKDVRIDELDRTTAEPWPLNFEGATPDLEFLKLEEPDKDGTKEIKFLSDWDTFFYGPRAEGEAKPPSPIRGFFNYYPVENAKTGAHIVARFTDPKAKLRDGTQQPFLVLSDPASHRRVVWLGAGEMWRLRGFREAYHERFWMKLMRYAAAGNLTKVSKRVRLEMATNYIANKFVEVEAQIFGRGGEPLVTTDRAKMPEIRLKMPDGVPDNEVPQPVIMTPKKTGEGWYSARFQVRSPGNYNLQLKVPETGDTQGRRFSVREANPEMDNTRPDFDAMYRLASEADEVLDRLGDAEKSALKAHLRKARPAEAASAPGDKPRLYFNLQNADLIPNCMRKDVAIQRSRGPIKDQWDDGWVLWEREPPLPPVKMSYVLTAVVGLLCMEWLIRKLLRLA